MVNAAEFQHRYGPWALVTGASSGIGASFVRQLAALGLHIVLTARREERLEAIASEVTEAFGVTCRVLPLDLSRQRAVKSLLRQTVDLDIGLIVNNAGFSHTGPLLAGDLERQLEMLQLNCRTPLVLAHSLGQRLLSRQRGGIVFLSSIVGYTAVPGWTNYAATKSYGLLLAEGLAAELEPDHIDVLAVCPGAVRTEFLEHTGIDTALAISPGAVAKGSIRNLGRKRVYVPGWYNRVAVQGLRAVPRSLATSVAAMVLKRWMQRFEQRKPVARRAK